MFRTLKYLWNSFKRRPTKRGFLIFLKMLKVEVKCLLLTGYSVDELELQSGGGIADAKGLTSLEQGL